MALRMAVNASVLFQPHTGIGIYLREILSRITALDKDITIDAFLGFSWCPLSDINQCLHDSPSTSSYQDRLKSIIKQLPGSRQAWYAMKRHQFQSRSKRAIHDVFWEPCFVPPGWMDPAVLTVHDLSHIRYPQYHPKSRLKWLNDLSKSLKKARAIIAVSEFSKREIIDVFGTDESKIFAIPNGVAPHFRTTNDTEVETICHKYGLTPKRYFFSLCTLEPRKNLTTLIKAYARLPKSVRTEIPLVLAGMGGWGRESNHAYLESICPDGRLIFPGYIPTDDLASLFSGATAFAYPSLYEGFGIPALESMACGAVTLLSDTDALVEVAGGQAQHIPTLDINAWTSALDWAIGLSATERMSIAQKSVLHAQNFTWDKTTQATVNVLYRASQNQEVNS